MIENFDLYDYDTSYSEVDLDDFTVHLDESGSLNPTDIMLDNNTADFDYSNLENDSEIFDFGGMDSDDISGFDSDSYSPSFGGLANTAQDIIHELSRPSILSDINNFVQDKLEDILGGPGENV
jgi:hypothetical protein